MPTTTAHPASTVTTAPQRGPSCRTCGDRLSPLEARTTELAGECRDCPRRRRVRNTINARRQHATTRWCREIRGPRICRGCHCERATIEQLSDDELAGLCFDCHDAGHR